MTFLEELVDSTRRRIGELHELVTPEALEQRIASVETPRGFHTVSYTHLRAHET